MPKLTIPGLWAMSAALIGRAPVLAPLPSFLLHAFCQRVRTQGESSPAQPDIIAARNADFLELLGLLEPLLFMPVWALHQLPWRGFWCSC